MTIEASPPVKSNMLALIGMIAGIVAAVCLLAGCCVIPIAGYVIAVIFGLAALIMGFVAQKQIKNSEGAQSGKGMALAAMIMGIASLVLGTLLLIFILLITIGLIASPAFLDSFQGMGGYY